MFDFLSSPSFHRLLLEGISATSVNRRKKLPIVMVGGLGGGDREGSEALGIIRRRMIPNKR